MFLVLIFAQISITVFSNTLREKNIQMPVTYFGELLGMGTPELVIILVIVLLLFGGKKLPELSRSIGTSIKELRKGINDGKDKPSQTPPNNRRDQ